VDREPSQSHRADDRFGRHPIRLHRDDGLISPDLRGLDRALDDALNRVLSGQTSFNGPAGRADGAGSGVGSSRESDGGASLADRVFAASRDFLGTRRALPGELQRDRVGGRFPDSAESLEELASLGTHSTTLRFRSGSGRGLWSTASVRAARVALAAAAAIAVAAGSWIVLHSDATPARDAERELVTRPSEAPERSANSAAELTLVAMLGDRHGGSESWMSDSARSGSDSVAGLARTARTWLSDERLGRSEAARLAAPVLRTQGAAIDDIESELGAILGLSFGSAADLPTDLSNDWEGWDDSAASRLDG
jgi:hypothetical protein